MQNNDHLIRSNDPIETIFFYYNMPNRIAVVIWMRARSFKPYNRNKAQKHSRLAEQFEQNRYSRPVLQCECIL